MKRIVFCILLFLALPSLLFAQKKALQQEEGKLWRTLREPNLSPDGRWVTYRYAYLYDTGNQDVRTEGMSYGMMICVQLDKQAEFDKLWRWAKKYMLYTSGKWSGYYAWHCTQEYTCRM